MKLVSFKIAKKIKAAGFPQNVTSLYYTEDGEFFDWNDIEEWDDKYYSRISIPTYFEVWIWLSQFKNQNISVVFKTGENGYCYWESHWTNDSGRILSSGPSDSQEEALIEAIDYVVDSSDM